MHKNIILVKFVCCIKFLRLYDISFLYAAYLKGFDGNSEKHEGVYVYVNAHFP